MLPNKLTIIPSRNFKIPFRFIGCELVSITFPYIYDSPSNSLGEFIICPEIISWALLLDNLRISIRNDHNYSYKGNIIFSTPNFHDITETARKKIKLLYTSSNCPHDAHEETKSIGHILWLMSY